MRFTLGYAVVATLVSCAAFVRGDDDGVVFLYPPSSLTVNYKDSVKVSYTSPFHTPRLFTFCTAAGSKAVKTELVQNDIPSYNGSILVPITFSNAQVCWFDLAPNATSSLGVNSHSITILPSPAASPIIHALDSTTIPPSSTTTHANTPSPTPHPKPHPNRHPHIALIIAVTVVVLVVCAALLLLGFYLYRRRRRRGMPGTSGRGYRSVRERSLSLQHAQYLDQSADRKWHPGGGGGAGEYVYVRPMQSYGNVKAETRRGDTGQGRSELDATQRPVELSGLESRTYPSAPGAAVMGAGVSDRREGAELGDGRVNPNRFSWEPSRRIQTP